MAEDAVLVTENEDMLTAFVEVCGRRNLGVNAAKSKLMVVEGVGES